MSRLIDDPELVQLDREIAASELVAHLGEDVADS